MWRWRVLIKEPEPTIIFYIRFRKRSQIAAVFISLFLDLIIFEDSIYFFAMKGIIYLLDQTQKK